jgi:hypothetical protein
VRPQSTRARASGFRTDIANLLYQPKEIALHDDPRRDLRTALVSEARSVCSRVAEEGFLLRAVFWREEGER